MADYVSSTVLKQSAEADEASSTDVFDRLATAVSRQFDREAEVPDNFFAAQVSGAEGIVERVFRSNGTPYLQIDQYAPGSIDTVSFDADYIEADGHLIFPEDDFPVLNEFVTVKARFGFTAVPVDIVQACIEQALFIWRRRDMAFAEMSGVSTAAITAEYAPTFAATAKRYRELYSKNHYFA